MSVALVGLEALVGLVSLVQEWNSDFGLDKDRKKESRPGFLASRKDSRTKVVLARKFEKQGLGSTPVQEALVGIILIYFHLNLAL